MKVTVIYGNGDNKEIFKRIAKIIVMARLEKKKN